MLAFCGVLGSPFIELSKCSVYVAVVSLYVAGLAADL